MTIKSQLPPDPYDTLPSNARIDEVRAMADDELEDAYAAAVLERQLASEQAEQAILRRERAEGEADLIRKTLNRRTEDRAYEQASIKRAQLAAE